MCPNLTAILMSRSSTGPAGAKESCCQLDAGPCFVLLCFRLVALTLIQGAYEVTELHNCYFYQQPSLAWSDVSPPYVCVGSVSDTTQTNNCGLFEFQNTSQYRQGSVIDGNLLMANQSDKNSPFIQKII